MSMELFTTRSSILENVEGKKATFSIYNFACKKELYHPGETIEVPNYICCIFPYQQV